MLFFYKNNFKQTQVTLRSTLSRLAVHADPNRKVYIAYGWTKSNDIWSLL